MEKRITIFFVMTMLLVSVSPLGAFAQIPGTVPPPPGTADPCIPVEEAPQPLTKEEYVKIALRNICLNPDTFDRDRGKYTDGNWRWINRAITARYSELYAGHPEVFKWAGMAAYASYYVGWGMTRLASIASGFNSDLFNALSRGNIELYLNIAWQHEAYLREGICAIERIHREGKLGANQREANQLLSAWTDIDTGMKEGKPELVWRGNNDLLIYEQNVFLPRVVYNPHAKLWQDVTDSYLIPIFSPIPGDSVTFVDYMKKAYPTIKPNVGNVDQRWSWISNSMLPKYKALEETGRVKADMQSGLGGFWCRQPNPPRSPIPLYCPCSENKIAPESTPQSAPVPFPTLTPSEPSTAAPVPFPTLPPSETPTEAPPREEVIIEEEVIIDTTDPAENPPEGPSEQSSAE